MVTTVQSCSVLSGKNLPDLYAKTVEKREGATS